MTKVVINPGACGMPVTVEIEKREGKIFSLKISSECKMVEKLGSELPELSLIDAFKRLLDNPVFTKGATCLRHVACPVPSGILKALEVEAGLNLPKNVSITFVREEGRPGENGYKPDAQVSMMSFLPSVNPARIQNLDCPIASDNDNNRQYARIGESPGISSS